MDNYIRNTGKTEVLTAKEKSENNAFLKAVLKTAPMRAAHKFLVKQSKASSNLVRSFDSLSMLVTGGGVVGIDTLLYQSGLTFEPEQTFS